MAPLAVNHIGLTVPDIDRAIDWYGKVMGFRLIFRRMLEYRPEVPEVREIFGERLRKAHQAHLLSANGVGLELFQFVEPPVEPPQDNFRYWQTGPFHICVTDPDLDGLVKRIRDNGGKQRSRIWTFLPDRNCRLVYCEDPFGNIVEAFDHSYAETFANMPGWRETTEKETHA